MNNNISVKRAIRKGKIILLLIPFLIIFTVPIFGGFLLDFYKLPLWLIPFFIILGIILGCLFWSYNVVNWKIWAYENVRNVHDLKQKAIRHNLIHSDDSWLNKTEIINDYQRQKLKQLEKKFLIEDVYFDDKSIPTELKVRYSKWKALLNIVVFGVSILLGFGFKSDKKEILGWAIIIICTFCLFKNLMKLIRLKPLFIINHKGIETPDFGFLNWNLIPYCYVEQRGLGKHSEEFFIFFAQGNGSFELCLNDTNISMERLEEYIRIYRIRFENES